MKVIAVIPARMDSKRLKEKVLIDICGKPMIQHVYERVSLCSMVDETIIACDDDRVVDAAYKFGANAVMTSKDHTSGSDRIAEIVKDLDCDVVINVQGDEPLIHGEIIEDLIGGLTADIDADMATVAKEIENKTDFENPNIVKVVTDLKKNALYFSRAPIPYDRDSTSHRPLKHIGIYGFKKGALIKFSQLPKSVLEETEKLEQLRALEAGMTIKVIETEFESIGVDTEEELEKVRKVVESGIYL